MREPQPMKLRTFKDNIYFYLKDAIIEQKIEPNRRLRERDIAKQFGISTTPVREAFLKLEGEGYLSIDAHRGVTVKPLSHSELIELYQVVKVLDIFAAGLATKNIDNRFLKELQKIFEKMKNAAETGKIEEYLNLSVRFHILIWENAGNKRLYATLKELQNQVVRYREERLSLYSNPAIMKKSISTNKEIVQSFIIADRVQIEKAVQNHYDTLGIGNS
jgi:DNA-binding GntR family transcriptional regulator